MLAYKVVEKKTRYSSNAALWLRLQLQRDGILYYEDVPPDRLYHYDNLEYVIDNYDIRNYILKYDIGAELHAIPNSPGIMCFKSEANAQEFIVIARIFNTMIIKVKGEDIVHTGPIRLIVRSGNICRLNDYHKPTEYEDIYYTGMVSFNKVTVLT